MSQSIKVFKFGGASLKDSAAIKHIGEILQRYQEEKLMIIVSATGKTTNALEKVVNAYFYQEGDAFAALDTVRKNHFQILDDLFEPNAEVYAAINDFFTEIEWVIEDEVQDSYDYIYDQIVSIGEMVSSKIVVAYLNKIGIKTSWLDVRDVILTDNTFREAKINWAQTTKNATAVVPALFEKNQFVVSQGFVGGTSENFTTTLGREGSDFSAAIFSFCLDVESMSIWKDVPGILTADPKLFKNVMKVDRLSYKEAIEMTYYGAKVIHPKTIKPLQNKNIGLYVKSFVEPEGSGTFIGSDILVDYPPVIVVEKEQVLLHIAARDFSFIAEHHLSFLFGLFATHRIKINMMQNNAISFAVCVTNKPKRINAIMDALKDEFRITKDEHLELITVRHYEKGMLRNLREGKIVMLEGKTRQTIQLVLKDIPLVERIDKVVV